MVPKGGRSRNQPTGSAWYSFLGSESISLPSLFDHAHLRTTVRHMGKPTMIQAHVGHSLEAAGKQQGKRYRCGLPIQVEAVDVHPFRWGLPHALGLQLGHLAHHYHIICKSRHGLLACRCCRYSFGSCNLQRCCAAMQASRRPGCVGRIPRAHLSAACFRVTCTCKVEGLGERFNEGMRAVVA
jgi:hypothetical protein